MAALHERWSVAWLEHPQLPLVVVTADDHADGGADGGADGDPLVYVGFSLETRARFHDLRAHATRHGARLCEVSTDEAPAGLRAALDQLRAYLDGRRRDFSLPLRPLGTAFQRRAWQALCAIPYGEIRSYGQQAAALGQPGAARAVGHANGHNPISIVVPCHRVVGADGRLTGFGGGIEAKRWLLELERRGVPPTWTPVAGPRRPVPADADQLGLFAS